MSAADKLLKSTLDFSPVAIVARLLNTQPSSPLTTASRAAGSSGNTSPNQSYIAAGGRVYMMALKAANRAFCATVS
ncbi:hypothetical protein D3C86_1949810 [compost metagenome]